MLVICSKNLNLFGKASDARHKMKRQPYRACGPHKQLTGGIEEAIQTNSVFPSEFSPLCFGDENNVVAGFESGESYVESGDLFPHDDVRYERVAV